MFRECFSRANAKGQTWNSLAITTCHVPVWGMKMENGQRDPMVPGSRRSSSAKTVTTISYGCCSTHRSHLGRGRHLFPFIGVKALGPPMGFLKSTLAILPVQLESLCFGSCTPVGLFPTLALPPPSFTSSQPPPTGWHWWSAGWLYHPCWGTGPIVQPQHRHALFTMCHKCALRHIYNTWSWDWAAVLEIQAHRIGLTMRLMSKKYGHPLRDSLVGLPSFSWPEIKTAALPYPLSLPYISSGWFHIH